MYVANFGQKSPNLGQFWVPYGVTGAISRTGTRTLHDHVLNLESCVQRTHNQFLCALNWPNRSSGGWYVITYQWDRCPALSPRKGGDKSVSCQHILLGHPQSRPTGAGRPDLRRASERARRRGYAHRGSFFPGWVTSDTKKSSNQNLGTPSVGSQNRPLKPPSAFFR